MINQLLQRVPYQRSVDAEPDSYGDLIGGGPAWFLRRDDGKDFIHRRIVGTQSTCGVCRVRMVGHGMLAFRLGGVGDL